MFGSLFEISTQPEGSFRYGRWMITCTLPECDWWRSEQIHRGIVRRLSGYFIDHAYIDHNDVGKAMDDDAKALL